MAHELFMTAYLVDDYDKAIDYFVNCLEFTLLEDIKLSEEKRWVVIGAKKGGAKLLLAKATGEQAKTIGNQFGGRVGLFMQTDDFHGTYSRFKENSVNFVEEPRNEVYGWVVVFKDLYGQKWDLLEKK
ncbi:MAG: VOC family protein [Caulobacterales bacterium]|nr:VOC family protein [Caulobacterales bacterium]MCA0371952.1 VOC family protein [Pseudomonadota bacterium]